MYKIKNYTKYLFIFDEFIEPLRTNPLNKFCPVYTLSTICLTWSIIIFITPYKVTYIELFLKSHNTGLCP